MIDVLFGQIADKRIMTGRECMDQQPLGQPGRLRNHQVRKA